MQQHCNHGDAGEEEEELCERGREAPERTAAQPALHVWRVFAPPEDPHVGVKLLHHSILMKPYRTETSDAVTEGLPVPLRTHQNKLSRSRLHKFVHD